MQAQRLSSRARTPYSTSTTAAAPSPWLRRSTATEAARTCACAGAATRSAPTRAARYASRRTGRQFRREGNGDRSPVLQCSLRSRQLEPAQFTEPSAAGHHSRKPGVGAPEAEPTPIDIALSRHRSAPSSSSEAPPRRSSNQDHQQHPAPVTEPTSLLDLCGIACWRSIQYPSFLIGIPGYGAVCIPRRVLMSGQARPAQNPAIGWIASWRGASAMSNGRAAGVALARAVHDSLRVFVSDHVAALDSAAAETLARLGDSHETCAAPYALARTRLTRTWRCSRITPVPRPIAASRNTGAVAMRAPYSASPSTAAPGSGPGSGRQDRRQRWGGSVRCTWHTWMRTSPRTSRWLPIGRRRRLMPPWTGSPTAWVPVVL
ncbi:hypothetical protein JD77_06283 [Micromonospora olivasterospora]|uniref:Uncharacterized protein n=1 Tax=Micromonospora olivasterospora TaxID=1880 RepID=A0A562IK55_MICOL|nr:hypothetical protein JD77_06283 [Micromonospora olivasterospora]